MMTDEEIQKNLASRLDPESLLTPEQRVKGFTKCDHCRWFLNRCRGECSPAEYDRRDREVWTA